MPTVAEQLRQAREQRGWTINQLADATKIRTDHIRALEEGNYNVFAAPVYIQGFVRTCATLLKLDVPKVMADLDGELGATKKFRQHPPLTDDKRGFVDWLMLQLSKINWTVALPLLLLALVLLVAVFSYRMYKHTKSLDPLKELSPGLYQGGPQGETLPIPTNTNR